MLKHFGTPYMESPPPAVFHDKYQKRRTAPQTANLHEEIERAPLVQRNMAQPINTATTHRYRFRFTVLNALYFPYQMP